MANNIQLREDYDLEVIMQPDHEGFRITNDGMADWAVRKIREERAEYARISEIAEEQLAQINAALEAANNRCISHTSFLLACLRQYFESVSEDKKRDTKTQKKYQLLSGSLVYTKPKETLEKDDEQLLTWLKKAGAKDYIKTEEKPAWAEFKKTLTIVDGKAVTEDGEVVECITVSEKPGSFDVK